MNSALLYLQYHSVKNRTVMRIKRLKQPKYLLGGIVGGLYFYWYFFRTLFGTPTRGQPFALLASPESQALLESIGALILLIILLLAWIIPHQRAALTFTEAEVAFLFPAADARNQPYGRPRLASRRRLLADPLHREPAFARLVLCPDDAAGPWHQSLAAAFGHSCPGGRADGGSNRLGPADHACL
jgi:hypothetical protein